MGEFLSVTALAFLQGVAEFLPISSSGHLVIGQHFLGMHDAGMRLNVMLHFGTLLAIFAYYRREIFAIAAGCLKLERESIEYAGKLIVAAIPAIPVYFVFREGIESLQENVKMVGALLMFTGAVLIGTRLMPRGSKNVGWWRALIMGIGQAVALLPGVSRSGMTLAAARGARVDGSKAAEFSFLMSAPLILGGTLLQTFEAFSADACAVEGAVEVGWNGLIWGIAVSAVVGYASLAVLVKVIRGRGFWLFGPYCIGAGLITLLFAS